LVSLVAAAEALEAAESAEAATDSTLAAKEADRVAVVPELLKKLVDAIEVSAS
jgi:hypothetical protein